MTGPSFAQRLEDLVRARGPLDGSVQILSDLNRAQRAEVSAVWKRIPKATRVSLVAEAAILAEDDVSFDFEALMLVALDDPEPSVRRLAAAGLAERPGREAVRRMGGLLLNDPDQGVRAAAAAALLGPVVDWDGRGGFEAAHREVLELLRIAATQDQSRDVRAQAMIAAAAAPRPWLRPLLEEAYYGDDRRLRLAAIEAMGLTCDERWLEFLVEQLGSDDAEFRAEAAEACGELGAEDAIEPLAALAGDEEPEVMLAAIGAIAKIGGPLALEVLQDLRADPPPGVDLELLTAAINELRHSLSLFGGEVVDA